MRPIKAGKSPCRAITHGVMSQEAGFSEGCVNSIRVMLSLSEGNLARAADIGKYIGGDLMKAKQG